jgi:hypothetical protein
MGGIGSLSQTLAVGNTTGGYNILLSGSDVIADSAAAFAFLDLNNTRLYFTDGFNNYSLQSDLSGGTIEMSVRDIVSVTLEQSYVQALVNGINIWCYSQSTGNETKIQLGTIFSTITSTYATYAGLEYAADYSVNYTNRSLVDKGYVTGLNLGAFAATTSAQLAGVISDETGSGALVFGTSPTFTTDITSPSIVIIGNISAAAWTTDGVAIKQSTNTYTDTSSSGTVASAYTNRFGGSTIVASNATTYTNYYGSYFTSPTAGSNVTFTNRYSAGFDTAIQVTTGGSSSIESKSGGTTSQAGVYCVNNSNITSGISCYGSAFGITDLRSNGGFFAQNSVYIFTNSSVANGGSGSIVFMTGGYTPSTQTRLTISSAGVITIASGSYLTGRIAPRVTTITSSATPTINTDNCDAVTITALAAAITSFTTNLSGTPNNFDKLTIRIKDDGTARAIAWGASFEAKGVALPTTTVISKVLTVGFIYDSVSAKWGCVSSAQEV